jgi:hypothetical protein
MGMQFGEGVRFRTSLTLGCGTCSERVTLEAPTGAVELLLGTDTTGIPVRAEEEATHYTQNERHEAVEGIGRFVSIQVMQHEPGCLDVASAPSAICPFAERIGQLKTVLESRGATTQ